MNYNVDAIDGLKILMLIVKIAGCAFSYNEIIVKENTLVFKLGILFCFIVNQVY